MPERKYDRGSVTHSSAMLAGCGVPRDCRNADEKSARASRTDFWQRRSSGEQKVAGLQTVQRHVLQHNGRGTDWALLAAFGAPGSGAKNPVPGGRIADAHRTHCC